MRGVSSLWQYGQMRCRGAIEVAQRTVAMRRSGSHRTTCAFERVSFRFNENRIEAVAAAMSYKPFGIVDRAEQLRSFWNGC